MAVPLQLSMWALTFVGNGYWLWWVAGRPRAVASFAWLWCGLAGFAVHVAVLQGLVYLDVPARVSAPWAAIVSAVGVLLAIAELARSLRRSRGQIGIGLVIVAVAAGVAVQSRSVAAIGAERYVGRATLDQVNYVLIGQFVADLPFSTNVADIGLRPWLYKPVLAKRERISQCVALADNAVLSRTSVQRAWAASALWCLGLLGLAAAGCLRVLARGSWAWCAGAGFWCAALPAAAAVFVDGFYSQVWTLWTFPALIAICAPGALPRQAQIICAASVLSFLFGAYTELFPIGAGIVALLLLVASRAPVRTRLLTAAVTFAGCGLLAGGNLASGVEYLLRQISDASHHDYLPAWFADSGGWAGWADNFFAGGGRAGGVATGILAAAAALGCGTKGIRTRRWLALAPPAALAIYLLLQPRVPTYALFKLGLSFAPLVVILALAGARALTHALPKARTPMAALVVAALAASAVSTGNLHAGVVPAGSVERARLDALWAVRDRTETEHGKTYVIRGDNSYLGAWLAYFARGARAYYLGDAVSDRRAPSSRVEFRRLPAGIACTWLDLERRGPAEALEPTLQAALIDANTGHELDSSQGAPIGRRVLLRLRRAEGFEPATRRVLVQFGFVPLQGRCRLSLVGADGRPIEVDRPTLADFVLGVRPGQTDYTLEITPAIGSADGVTGLIADLSVEEPATATTP